MENKFNILNKTAEGIIFNVKIVPDSSFNKIIDYNNDYVRIKISAPPLNNRANKELTAFCSDLFKINKSKISIISGEKSKIKKVLLKTERFEEITQKLMFVLNSIQKEKKE